MLLKETPKKALCGLIHTPTNSSSLPNFGQALYSQPYSQPQRGNARHLPGPQLCGNEIGMPMIFLLYAWGYLLWGPCPLPARLSVQGNKLPPLPYTTIATIMQKEAVSFLLRPTKESGPRRPHKDNSISGYQKSRLCRILTFMWSLGAPPLSIPYLKLPKNHVFSRLPIISI